MRGEGVMEVEVEVIIIIVLCTYREMFTVKHFHQHQCGPTG